MSVATLKKAIKYTATLPNGEVLVRKSKRVLLECHVAICKETGNVRIFRWTENSKPLSPATASSCGFSFGFKNPNKFPNPRTRAEIIECNKRAEETKNLIESSFTFHIIPAVAA
jgi:hypothetical protein